MVLSIIIVPILVYTRHLLVRLFHYWCARQLVCEVMGSVIKQLGLSSTTQLNILAVKRSVEGNWKAYNMRNDSYLEGSILVHPCFPYPSDRNS